MNIQVANRNEARRNERIMITILPLIIAAIVVVQHLTQMFPN